METILAPNDHLSPPSTTSRLSDSDTTSECDIDGITAGSSLGSSSSPPPEVNISQCTTTTTIATIYLIKRITTPHWQNPHSNPSRILNLRTTHTKQWLDSYVQLSSLFPHEWVLLSIFAVIVSWFPLLYPTTLLLTYSHLLTSLTKLSSTEDLYNYTNKYNSRQCSRQLDKQDEEAHSVATWVCICNSIVGQKSSLPPMLLNCARIGGV